ncbi:MAG: MerC domain-containing protein [Deltaproteobacteria bacterium]|nr:MerC domain-containing protein [Deltaproteobacteria bacterium]
MSVEILEIADAPETADRLDRIGAGVSIACAVHCILTPLLVGVLPLGSLAFHDHRELETVFICVSFLLATFSLSLGYRIHRRGSLFILFVLSIGLMLLSRLFVHSVNETVLLVLGATGIAACHITNRRLCASCPECSGEHAPAQ